MVIWDALFASLSADLIFPSPLSTSRPSFELALWICVAMLIRIRNKRRCLAAWPCLSVLTPASSYSWRLHGSTDLFTALSSAVLAWRFLSDIPFTRTPPQPDPTAYSITDTGNGRVPCDAEPKRTRHTC